MESEFGLVISITKTTYLVWYITGNSKSTLRGINSRAYATIHEEKHYYRYLKTTIYVTACLPIALVEIYSINRGPAHYCLCLKSTTRTWNVFRGLRVFEWIAAMTHILPNSLHLLRRPNDKDTPQEIDKICELLNFVLNTLTSNVLSMPSRVCL